MSTVLSDEDSILLGSLRAGDEDAFRRLVRTHHRAMLLMALSYTRSEAVAEEVVQETWLAVLQGLDGFEGRSSLKTWIFAVLVNRARSRGQREHRSTPVSSFSEDGVGPGAVPAGRFRGPGDPFEGYWVTPPVQFGHLPEERVAAAETLRLVTETIKTLPPRQQQVIALRDIEGWSSAEVCSFLELSEANQRVLLHRARSQVRLALEAHFSLQAAS